VSDGKSRISADALARYDDLIATQPAVERKGASMPYTSVNGHMFSFLTKEGALALRLDAGGREELHHEHGARPCVQYGRVMKEYVEVPAALLDRAADLARYFARSYAYVASLQPKPTTRRTKGGGKKSLRGPE
jgi:hypothetical protein